MSETLIRVQSLSKTFPGKPCGLLGKREVFTAVDKISFSIQKAETLGLVGESGCGKSTTGQMMVGLTTPDGGKIFFKEKEVTRKTEKQLRPMRRNLQMIFQNPYASLNPKMNLQQILEEPFKIHHIKDRQDRIHTLLDYVGLSQSFLPRYPWEFSGGQRQRIAIARALALKPEFIVADEAVSALDVSIQAQILNLLRDLQKELALTCLFISHDLSVVQYISQRIAVMYMGRIVETADCNSLYKHPLHPYTRLLLASIPVPDPDKPFVFKPGLARESASPQPLSGCGFAPQCEEKTDVCSRQRPELKEIIPGHFAACHNLNQEKETRHALQ